MKVIILAGGQGSRLSEETQAKPKPMVEIGGKPILWHIMKIYGTYGLNEFIICCGYKGHFIKEYFANYFLQMSDVTFDLRSNQIEIHKNLVEPWRVTLVDTGEETQTGGRLKRVQNYINHERFCFTYGDGLANLNLNDLFLFHKKQNRLATVTAVKQPSRYGNLSLENDLVLKFQEKPQPEQGWISGGYFILEPEVFEWLEDDQTSWEQDVLPLIASKGELSAFKHYGFWQGMDTLRDKKELESLWATGKAPWKIW